MLIFAALLPSASAFQISRGVSSIDTVRPAFPSRPSISRRDVARRMVEDGGGNGGSTSVSSLSESDQILLGVFGTSAGLVTLYSEFVLKSTGCGLPAGPFGLVGACEGVSYLGIVGVAGFAGYTKIKTGSGLPAGPGGILGLAEGLSFLSVVVGLVVFGFQLTDYGYIPNAVPMEGGMCQ